MVISNNRESNRLYFILLDFYFINPAEIFQPDLKIFLENRQINYHSGFCIACFSPAVKDCPFLVTASRKVCGNGRR